MSSVGGGGVPLLLQMREPDPLQMHEPDGPSSPTTPTPLYKETGIAVPLDRLIPLCVWQASIVDKERQYCMVVYSAQLDEKPRDEQVRGGVAKYSDLTTISRGSRSAAPTHTHIRCTLTLSLTVSITATATATATVTVTVTVTVTGTATHSLTRTVVFTFSHTHTRTPSRAAEPTSKRGRGGAVGARESAGGRDTTHGPIRGGAR